MRTRFGFAACSIVVVLGCGSSASNPKGSSGAGGISSGGANAGATGGAGGATGGSATGGSATGGTAGSSSGGASGTGGAGASGAPNGGAGGALSGNPITFGKCPAFTPCGGDETGTWSYTSVCVDPSTIQDAIHKACANAVSDFRGVIDGTLSFVGGTVTRTGSYTVIIKTNVPSQCVIGSCAVVQAAMDGQIPGSICTNGTQGSCDCTGRVTGGSIATQAYTANGNTITLADGRTFDYCVTNGTLVYTETTKNADPGTFTLSHQ